MGKKQNLIKESLYSEMRESVVNSVKNRKATRREISNDFNDYTLRLGFPFYMIFGTRNLGILMESFEGPCIEVASVTQMERPAKSGYYFNFAYLIRPDASLRAPIFHGEAQDPMAGMKGSFAMDMYNTNPEDLDLDGFLGDNIEKISEAREIVKSYEKTEKQGRGKYTKYSEGYKSAYRIELLQPPANDLEALKKFNKAELESFNLYLEAYLDSLYKLTPEKNIKSSNKNKFSEFFELLKTKDFAAKMGKRIFKGDFQKYFFEGFWNAK